MLSCPTTSKQYFPLIVLHTYKSTKSALDLTLRKRREDLLPFIKKQASPNA
ncbi:unknown [Prevotella sp. CAG:255]|nr:unknown [Prevotella sp. CAG:255]